MTGLLVFAWVRRGRRGLGTDTDDPHPGERPAWFVVVGMGVVVPLTVICGVLTTSSPCGESTCSGTVPATVGGVKVVGTGAAADRESPGLHSPRK